MKKPLLIALSTLMVLSLSSIGQPSQARSVGRMLQSAANAVSGRDAYWNRYRYGYPGYGYYGYHPYWGYHRYYGYRPYWHRAWY